MDRFPAVYVPSQFDSGDRIATVVLSHLASRWPTSGARRFDGVEPGSRAGGKHATGRSKPKMRGVP
jgi:hypothetical protein